MGPSLPESDSELSVNFTGPPGSNFLEATEEINTGVYVTGV